MVGLGSVERSRVPGVFFDDTDRSSLLSAHPLGGGGSLADCGAQPEKRGGSMVCGRRTAAVAVAHAAGAGAPPHPGTARGAIGRRHRRPRRLTTLTVAAAGLVHVAATAVVGRAHATGGREWPPTGAMPGATDAHGAGDGSAWTQPSFHTVAVATATSDDNYHGQVVVAASRARAVRAGVVPPPPVPYYAPPPPVPAGGHRRPLAAVLAAPTALADILTAVFPGGRFEVAAAAAALVAAAAAVVVAAEVMTAAVDVIVAALVARRRRRADWSAVTAVVASGGSPPMGATGWLPGGGAAADGDACGRTAESVVDRIDDGCCDGGKAAAKTLVELARGKAAADGAAWDGGRAVDCCGTPTMGSADANELPADGGDGHGHPIAAAKSAVEDVEDEEADHDGASYIDRDDFGREGWATAAPPVLVVRVVGLPPRSALLV